MHKYGNFSSLDSKTCFKNNIEKIKPFKEN